MGVILGPGVNLRLTISDPFELSQSLDVQVVSVHSFADGAETERVLIALPASIEWSGITYNRVVLERRSAPGLVDELQLGETVAVNGYGTNAAAGDAPPWGVDTWRGSLAILGTVGVQ